jgi:hypothetical protein
MRAKNEIPSRLARPAKVAITVFIALTMALRIQAQERLCDSAFEDCRTPIWNLIDNENTEIDIGFWFMQDTSYVSKIIARFNAGVKVRIIVDPRADPTESGNQQILSQFAQAGIPMEYKLAGGIYHWKMMLFAGQNKLQFSGADYGPAFFFPTTPYSNYIDESPYFTDDPVVVNSFKTAFDNLWTDSTDYGPFANMSGTPMAAYPTYQISSDLCFPPTVNNPLNNYGSRAVQQMDQENQKIDVDMYRITSTDFSTASVSAVNRGVPVRFLGDTSEYRDPTRLWDSYNIELMHMAGVQIKLNNHQGINHQKSMLLYGQAMTVYGSSNWSGPSENSQAEHNYFTTKSWFFQWFVNQFERKWNSSIEYTPFVPLPPDQPINLGPSNQATGQALSATLSWDGGNWGQLFDIYLGTSSTPPLIASNIQTANPGAGISQTFTATGLTPSTTYYWMIVGKTMAQIGATGPVWSFTTGASTSSSPPSISSISQASGPIAGGTSVSITGTGFVSGATVSFGNVPATSVTVSSATSIAATAPAHASGLVDVTVTNPDSGTATLPQSFTYDGPTSLPPPRANLIAPASGVPGGGTSVTVTGSYFQPSATVTIGGVAATGVTVTNGVEITATTPPGTLGSANVVVTNPDNQSSTLSSAYTYANPAPAPTVTSISPTSGPTSGLTAVTITGTGFQYGATVTVGGAPATTMIVYNSTTITCYTPSGSTGAADVVVTNYDGQTGKLSGGFSYFQAALTISSISPNSGSTLGGTAITITGTGFASTATVTIGGATATNVNVPNATTIYATTPANAAGAANVTVAVTGNQDMQTTLSGGFTYVQAPPPTASSISPNVGYTGGGNSVTISGSNFATGATVTIGGSAATSIVVQSAASITANTPPHVAATVNVVVTNPDGQSSTLSGGFTYSTSAPPPETVLVVADFSTNSLDTTHWQFGSLFSGTTDPSVPATVANQELQIGPLDQNTTGSHYNGITSIQSYNFTGAYSYAILANPAASDTAGDAMLTIGTDANDYYRIYVESGNLICQRKAAGQKTTLLTQAYSPTNDVYLRIRNDSTAGNAVFEVAPSSSGAPGTWTQIYSEPWNSAVSLTSLKFELKAGTFQAESNPPGTIAFGNFRAAVPQAEQQSPPPTISSISPNSGSTTGSTSVTISGAAFQNGLAVTIGSASASNVTVVSSTSLSATTPPGTAGAANVTVTNPNGQTATLSGGYTYVQAPPPSVTSVSPNTGNPSGGNTVTISGANFLNGATVSFAAAAATNVVVQNSNSMSVVTPANPAGTVNVVVTNPDGQSATLTSGFTYSNSAPGPETVLLASLDTTNWNVGALFSGTTDTSVPVTVANQQLQVGPLDENTSGSHYNGLVSAKSYNLTGGYAYIQLVTPPASNTAADAMLTIGTDVNDYYRIYYEAGNLICQKRLAGAAKATMFTGAYSATADSFLRIRNDATVGNVVFEVAPSSSGVPGAWTQVYSEAWSSAVSLTDIAFELKAGTWQVESNPPGTVVFANFRAAVPGSSQGAPTISGVTPNSGSTSGGTAITISGSGFQSGLTVTVGGAAATAVTVPNSTTINATTPANSAGAVNVVVTNPGGQNGTLSGGFTYVQPSTPSVTSVSPNTGSTAGGTSVTISGANFASGASVTFGSAPASNVVVQSSTSLTATTPANSAGAVSVTVTNPGGQSGGQSGTLSGGFTYVQPSSVSVRSVTPNTGSTAGGTSVTISGANFASGASVTFGGATATNVAVQSSTSITATTPANSAGEVSVTVTNSGGQSGTLSGGFTYVQPSTPSVSSISPNTGSTSGGTAATISGANFVGGATVTFGSASATNVVVQSGTSITATTPANSAGAVNVIVTNPGGQSGTLSGGFTYSAETVLLASLDTTNWTVGPLFSGTTDTSVPVKVANQQLQIGPLDQNTSGSHYNGLVSAKSYNFTGAYAYIQLVTPPASNTAADAMLTIGTDVNNYYRIYYEAGNLICQKKVAGGSKVTMLTAAYSPTGDSFFRIRNDSAGGNVIFEVAPNSSGSPGTWTEVYSEPWNSAVSITGLFFELKAGTWQPESNPVGTVVFANFRAAVPE